MADNVRARVRKGAVLLELPEGLKTKLLWLVDQRNQANHGPKWDQASVLRDLIDRAKK